MNSTGGVGAFGLDAATSWHGGRGQTCTHMHTHTGSLITKYYLWGNGTQTGTSGTPVQTAAHALTCDNLAKSAVQTHTCVCLHICSKSH